MEVMAQATDKGLSDVRKELDKVKSTVKMMEDPGPKGAAPTAAQPRSRSVGATCAFRPTKVFVQGFFDYKTEQGALRDSERDHWGQMLLSAAPSHLADKFKLEKKYKLTRRLVFTTSGTGGEVCWELREHLMNAIVTENYIINGKELKVRVEEQQERRDKKRNFWKAVEALREVKKEDADFIVEPSAFGIYEHETLQRLGSMEDGEYKWNEAVLSTVFPDVDAVALRRATVFGKKQ